MMSMNDNTKIVTALLAGLVAGAAAGLLLAPKKGSETRDELNTSVKKLTKALKESSAEQTEHLREFKEKALAALKTKLSKAAKRVEQDADEPASV
ncbi:YtxH domain-containing protein [Parapedobacter luteus]|nr:YtxH domain-containing protein [Parapedobacter luteus]